MKSKPSDGCERGGYLRRLIPNREDNKTYERSLMCASSHEKAFLTAVLLQWQALNNGRALSKL